MGFDDDDDGVTERVRAADLRPGDVLVRRPGLLMRVRRVRRRRDGRLIVLGWAVESQRSLYATLPITSYAPDDAVERMVERAGR